MPQLARLLLIVLCYLPITAVAAKQPEKPWTAQWIAHPDAPPQGAGVFHFRKTLELRAKPQRLIVRVSADNRYRLFVNGRSVSAGPARDDMMHWRYETVDLGPFLRPGRNLIAATVWNWGEHRPGAQISHRTAFLLQAEDKAHSEIDSGPAWKVYWNRAYSFHPVTREEVNGYYAAAPAERVDAALYPWGWEKPAFDDSNWSAAVGAAGSTLPIGAHPYGEASDWQLVPRMIPPMEERPIRFAEVRRTDGITAPKGFPSGGVPLAIPAKSKVSLLLDQRELTMGYPTLTASGGKGASATLTYAEGLFDAKGHKGNRGEIAGKRIMGVRDRFIFDGADKRAFQTLWLRTWRYVQLDIETASEPLRIDDVGAVFTAYPFEQRASFSSDQKWIGDIWDIDWRVFRLSTFETFWDTPYYEQFQYVGDSRIEALISMYNAGDDRLARNAIEQFDASRIPEGITASRYPSALPQYIPPFSLWWIGMVHDHWMYSGDAEFARRMLPGARSVIGWYERQLASNDLLGPMPWWNFVDWTFERGVPPGAETGQSTAISLQLAHVLRLAADLEQALGKAEEAQRYRAMSDSINSAARTLAWDPSRGLFADTPDKRNFSQQTNALAILSGAATDSRTLAQRMLGEKSITQASYYFRFYTDEALRQAGLADHYLDQLEPWREMLRLGLTTTLEEPEPSRSDSHAWSAHPNYHLLATVLGIRPAEPGFRKIVIAPALGELKHASGRMPTPQGVIESKFHRRGKNGLTGTIHLPAGTTGTLLWNGHQTQLKTGKNEVRR